MILSNIAQQAANEITCTDVQTSPPPLRPVNVSVGTSDPSAVRTLEQGTEMQKEGKKRPRVPKKPMAPLVPTPKLAVLPNLGLELHGVKVDWSTVDLSIALNTISRERRLAARREVIE
ncbi:hypothetical protein R1sor_015617 [Riccia sorocarpa]|uniref:Uncharacterized protein n=1 Tax=Riccia sorocarpa TaxID=122646 RepID=A0ABD3HD31_9MARC